MFPQANKSSQRSSDAVVEALQQSLMRIETQGLSAQGLAAIQSAKQSLDAIRLSLAANEEQKRLAVLYRVSQALGTSLNLNEVLNQAMDAVIGLTGAERGFVVLVDAQTGELELRAARNLEQKTLDDEALQVSRTVIQAVIESGEGVLTTNAQSDPRFAGQESVMAFALRSILCAPLRSRGRVFGVVYVDNRARTGMFTPEDLELMNAFAAQAAAAIENARLYTITDQRLAARVAELETLGRIMRELNARLDMEHILQITHKWSVEGTQAQSGWIALENSAGELTIAAGSGQGEKLARDHPALAAVFEAATPHVFPPGNRQPARLAAPILGEQRVIGAVVTEAERAFPPEALQFLTRLANQAASAIGKARLYENVQSVSEEKTKFVSVVTHELRLPMTSIQGYTDLIPKVGPVSEQQGEFLTVIRRNVDRMTALVSDLSDISRIESGRLLLELVPLPVDGYVNEIAKAFRPHLDAKRQRLDTNVSAALPRVQADANRLMQVLTNLVSNASKYSRSGSTINLSANQVGDFVRVEVRDQGLGISEEDQARLFTQFFRSEDAKVREELGWGLGLSVTKRLVELMGGEVGFASKLGQGSVFWFTLPVAQSAQARAMR